MNKEWGVEEKTKVERIRKCNEVWESIRRRSNTCSNLVDSMLSRLQQVVEVEGAGLNANLYNTTLYDMYIIYDMGNMCYHCTSTLNVCQILR